MLVRRLDRQSRALARAQRDIELLSEAFATFVKIWFAHTPALAPEARKGARNTAKGRYRQFVDFVAEHFSAGSRFLDELPREGVADDGDAAKPAGASGKAAPGTDP